MQIWVSIMLLLTMISMFGNYHIITGKEDPPHISISTRKIVFVIQALLVITGIIALLRS